MLVAEWGGRIEAQSAVDSSGAVCDFPEDAASYRSKLTGKLEA
jgi:hypothetical protein